MKHDETKIEELWHKMYDICDEHQDRVGELGLGDIADYFQDLAVEYAEHILQQERERIIEMLTPTGEWEKFMKFNNKYEYCKLCGFNTGKIIKAINQQGLL